MAATAERVILDPVEMTSTRTAFDLTDWIDFDGIDWGTASIEPMFSQRDRGEIPVDYRLPNREITIPLNLITQGGTTAITARANLQAKAALFQKEGGWLKRKTNSGGTVFADIVDASFTATSVSGFESQQNVDLDAELTLTCLPDFYEAERTLSDHTTGEPQLIFTETNVAGDYPARVRIVVDNDQTGPAVDQRGLIWGFRSRHYSSASTAELEYDAEEGTAMDTATVGALTGAHGGTAVTHGTISTNWTPVWNSNIGGTFLTHTGSYNLWGRVYSTSGTLVQCRAVWDVGDLVNPVENDAWRLPGGTAFFCHNFGELRLDPSPVGTHRWQAQIQAKGDNGTENFSIDQIWLEPVDEGCGVLTAPTPAVQGLVSYSARSEFNTESGAITGDALAAGGNWTVVTNSDTDDFSAAAGVATRTAVSDTGTGAGPLVGRGVTAGSTNYGGIVVSADVKYSATSATGMNAGVLARVTDSSNYIAYVIAPVSTIGAGYGFTAWLMGLKYKAASLTVLGVRVLTLYPGVFYRLTLNVSSSGQYTCSITAPGNTNQALADIIASAGGTFSGSDSDLSTLGTLATGKVGIVDMNSSATASTRTFDNFSALPNPTDAVIFGSRTAQLTTDGHYRLDSGGTAYGPVSSQTGPLPRLPVAGIEGRTTQVFLKPSRGDFDQLPDPHYSGEAGDDISAQVFYRPSWLHVPNT